MRITKRDGWAVLNADDPRAWAMRRLTRAAPYAFSLDRRRTDEVDGRSTRAAARRCSRTAGSCSAARRGGHGGSLEAADLPVTFAGLSRYNIANALAAAAACDALGLTTRQIKHGLRSFAQDRADNPGRLNLFERDGVFALVDFAHNEAGLAGLLDVARAVAGRPEGPARVRHGRRPDRRDPPPRSASSRAAPTTSSSPRSATTCAAATSRR